MCLPWLLWPGQLRRNLDRLLQGRPPVDFGLDDEQVPLASQPSRDAAQFERPGWLLCGSTLSGSGSGCPPLLTRAARAARSQTHLRVGGLKVEARAQASASWVRRRIASARMVTEPTVSTIAVDGRMMPHPEIEMYA